MPPLSTLRAFESVVRLRSIKWAAVELHVTPGAVSQQVKSLEADLGVKLIRRSGNMLMLTDQALRGRDHLSAGLRLLQQGVERMRTPAAAAPVAAHHRAGLRGQLADQAPARLSRIARRMDVLLDPAKELVDIARGEADLGIRFGQGLYAGLEAINLFEDEIFPVCSPGYLRANPIKDIEDLKHHHLLRLDWRATNPWPDWPEWLQAAG